MEVYEEIDIEKLFGGEDNLEDFNKFLKQYGIDDGFRDITLEHTKERLDALIAVAETGTDPKLTEKKAFLKELSDNLKGEKDKIQAMKALKKVYSELNTTYDMDEKTLDKKLKHALKEYKKYEHFKTHEEQIAQKWIRELKKEAIEYKKEYKELKKDVRRDFKRLER